MRDLMTATVICAALRLVATLLAMGLVFLAVPAMTSVFIYGLASLLGWQPSFWWLLASVVLFVATAALAGTDWDNP